MKAEFPGYFEHSPATLKKMWHEGIFSFDTNVLLHLYRYSYATREQMFKTLESIKDRIWIPHQVGLEFLERRLGVIADAKTSYDDISKPFNTIENAFESSRHPHIDDHLLKEFQTLSGKIKNHLEKRKSEFSNLSEADSIQERITELFAGKIGPKAEEQALAKIYGDGEKRYKNKIPPGFSDDKKEGIRKFGDLVLWMQLIEHAKKEKKAVILVADDRKDDWLRKFEGKIIGPRPELTLEMKEKAGVEFHMYSPERFLENAETHLKQKVSKDAIKEVKDVSADSPQLWATEWGTLTGDQLKMMTKVKQAFAIQILAQADKKTMVELLSDMNAVGITFDDLVAATSDVGSDDWDVAIQNLTALKQTATEAIKNINP